MAKWNLNDANSSWMMTAFAALLGMAVLGAIIHHHHWQNDDDDIDDDFDDDVLDNKYGNQYPTPFPWEPVAVKTPKKEHNKSIKSSSLSVDQQLDFLASMTFANGGVRPPNCPCCY
ncbi:hypothetical protein IV203_012898 [Nitzschia inconspicua]|uniref:Uncharacterized protein n=1 Tax=Nitzschia inconspicua TaxID=303405 RepID=A0A9K3M4W3_9STRA|nr:hypothetical protein IV203_012898 [Nitzschia inconspicua]